MRRLFGGFSVIALILGLSLGAPCHAETARTLQWKDLVPPAQTDSPFASLSKAQLQMLSDIREARDRMANGEKLNAIEREDERAATRKLEAAGIDVDGLLKKRREMMAQKAESSRAMNTALNGKLVRIPGYLLPLEFNGKQVTEFLLVPWVGACIHTPPPPPNQIVYVKPDKPYTSAGLFAPVWVTGQLSANTAKKSLYLIDGTSDVDVSYAIQGSTVEPYKEEK